MWVVKIDQTILVENKHMWFMSITLEQSSNVRHSYILICGIIDLLTLGTKYFRDKFNIII